jgi:hypothetical protein
MQAFVPVKNRQMVTLPQGNFWRKFPFFPKRIRQTSPFFFGGGSPHCRLSASYSFNNPVQKSDWNLVPLLQDPPINMESKRETSNIANHLDQPFYPGRLWRGGLRNMICSFAPLWPTLGFVLLAGNWVLPFSPYFFPLY